MTRGEKLRGMGGALAPHASQAVEHGDKSADPRGSRDPGSHQVGLSGAAHIWLAGLATASLDDGQPSPRPASQPFSKTLPGRFTAPIRRDRRRGRISALVSRIQAVTAYFLAGLLSLLGGAHVVFSLWWLIK